MAAARKSNSGNDRNTRVGTASIVTIGTKRIGGAELFMCRCPHYKEGKFSKFLDDPQCNVFELRNNGTVGQMGE